MLEYKAQRYGRILVKIGRFEPTSQTCSTCGVKDGPKPLSIREWTCTACGTVHDRDTNAAINVKTAAGLAVSACGAPVGPELVLARAKKQEATDSRPIPVPRSGTATSREGQNPRASARGASQRPGDRIRVTYGPTTVQVALTAAAGGRTVLRFHQERMASAEERERRRVHWQQVMERVAAALDERYDALR